VKELRLAGISTIEAANAFLPAFVQTRNARFAKPPARDRDLHRPIAGRSDLDDILCWSEQRSVSRRLMVNYTPLRDEIGHPAVHRRANLCTLQVNLGLIAVGCVFGAGAGP
jgi:hypothetical protein